MEKNTALEVDHLRFGFPKQPQLFEDLNLVIQRGTTFGILGPNGAGKSTLIKMAIGLIPFADGSVKIFGKKLSENRKEILEKVGFLIEGPRLYSHLSGMDNLKVFATYRHVHWEKLDSLLGEVGLTPHAHKLVRHYSTGMKQRLAIAVALLHDPDLLILDEPTNGLDPQGIAEIRQLILELKKKPERTIIFCSHILNEVQQVCDEVGILYEGKFVFQGPTDNFSRHTNQYLLEVDEVKTAISILQKNTGWKIKTRNNEIFIILNNPDEVSEVIDNLRRENVLIFQIKKIMNDLENTYLQFVKK